MKTLLRQVAGFSVIINLLWLAPALFSLQLFDRVMSSRSRETLLVLLGGLLLALVVTGLLEHVRGRLQGVIGNIVHDALAPEIARLTLQDASRRQGPIPMEPLRDVARLRNLFATPALLALLDAPWALVFVGVIALAHPLLGLGAAAAAALMLVLALLNNRISRRSVETVQLAAGQARQHLDQSLVNAEVAQALGMGDALIGRWRTLSAQAATVQGPAAASAVAMATLTRVTRQAVQVLMQALGAYLVLEGQATPGVMIASSMLLGRALAPVEQIVGSWKTLAEGRLAYSRLDTLAARIQKSPERMTLAAPAGRLQAQSLAYRPPGSERWLLNGVSLQLEPGESLAVLGPSGAGKSTLVRLLIGLWTPTGGTVRLDGAELSQWSREALGPHVGYVPQDVEMFTGTVADNIARMGPLDSPRVIEAAQRAGIHEMILGLPQGYDTMMDPHAALLSPGQRQRIALARALYGQPRLLILDEPNANMDGLGEAMLTETLRQLRGQATVVVVTHRTALTAHVDKILVMEAGRVAQYGPAAEVLQILQAPRQPRPGAVAMNPAAATTRSPT